MAYGVSEKIHLAFGENGLSLDVQKDYVVVRGFHNHTEAKIRDIVTKVGFLS